MGPTLIVLMAIAGCAAFVPPPAPRLGRSSARVRGSAGGWRPPQRPGRATARRRTALRANLDKYPGQDFDLLSLQSFSRETLLRYSAANQSEPLRILITALGALLAALGPLLADAVGGPLEPAGIAGCVAVSGGSFVLFTRERGNRLRKLKRMDSEFSLGALRCRTTATMTGASEEVVLRDLRTKQRVLVFYGPKAELAAALEQATVYRRRFAQSETLVVAVDSERGRGNTALPGWAAEGVGEQWDVWFSDVFKQRAAADDAAAPREVAYIALNFNGRSIGSGIGLPALDELLGSKLPPRAAIPTGDDKALAPRDAPILECQAAFYKNLLSGDVKAMRELLASEAADAASVTAALADGGRLDPWDSQLADGSRPVGLTVVSRDVSFAADGATAYSTCIEQSENGSLLATQRWARAGEQWKLAEHRTIPFAQGTVAGAILMCDSRGCVALVNSARR